MLDVGRKEIREAAEGIARDLEAGKGCTVLLGAKKEFLEEEGGWRTVDMGMAGKGEGA